MTPSRLRGELTALGRGSLLGTWGYIGVGVLELGLVVVIARGLGAAEAGILFTAIAVFMIARNVLQAGPVTGLVRMVARRRALGRTGDIRRLVAIAVVPVAIVGALLTASGFALAPSASEALVGGPEATEYLRALALFLPLAAVLSLLAAAARGLGSMLPTTAIEQLGVSAIRLALLLIAILAGLEATGIGLAWALPFALLLPPIGLWVRALLAREERAHERAGGPKPAPVGELARELWTFSAVRGIATLCRQTVQWVDIPLVAALVSPEAAGIYAAASRLVMAGMMGLRGIVLAISPQLSALVARGELELARATYRTATYWVIAVSAPVFIALAAYPAFLLGVFGPGFSAGADALLILALASLVNVATGPITAVLLMEGRTSLNLINAAVSVTLNVGLNLLLIPPLGIEGAAIAWAASITFENVAPLVQLWRSGGYHPFGRGFAVAVAACAGSYGLVGVLTPALLGLSARTSFVVLATAATALYGALLWRSRGALELGAFRPTLSLRALGRG